jgi:choline dehydrogenase
MMVSFILNGSCSLADRLLGWLSTSVGDASWAQNNSLPGTKILKKMAELTGQDPNNVANLANADILGAGKNVDQTTSFYNMATHATKLGKRSSPNNYVRATVADPAKYPLTVKLKTLVTRVLFDNSTTKAGSTPRAIGVEVMEGGSLYKADPKHVSGTKGPVSQICMSTPFSFLNACRLPRQHVLLPSSHMAAHS